MRTLIKRLKLKKLISARNVVSNPSP